ncbi:unnamed protein product [Cyprideis torosa]|uniref:Sodium/potassium exporting P-type ATPase 1 n=1 Tax=Cyprideis torosa TaxID=163714 RepID=A0A7R8WKX3_9CRUS|nr:unnamed protein product [Cyprideis torosa]CAG0897392.1 unnamed protein product [Cyprideis torosa]
MDGIRKLPMAEKDINWYVQSPQQIAERLEVDIAVGLSEAAVNSRLQRDGPNRLPEKPPESRLKKFLRQYKDFMQIILVSTGLVALVVLHDYQTTILLFALTLLNAWMGLSQEAKAEASIGSLRSMMELQARVRRDGQDQHLPADQLVVGDVVLFEAGDKVPADGRLIEAATLEIEEAALTGESTPTLKSTEAIDGDGVALGDRHNMAFMNTTVTRGRGKMIVTGTGAGTEIGHIATMTESVLSEKTPLQKQLDRLTIIMASVAGVALVAMTLIGLSRDLPLSVLVITGVSMAIAAVPTGLPAVVTSVLALGTTTLARTGAIVKRLTSVETLGSTSAICSDKTGTLTLNQMTVREVNVAGHRFTTLGSTSAICSDKTGTLTLNQMTVREVNVAGHRFTVDGEGYSTKGTIRFVGEASDTDIRLALISMALNTDAVLDGENLIGDPTEGALIVLAEKGGVDVRGTRERYPRLAEVPFDSAYKLMATFHEMADKEGNPIIRAWVKGAPDVLLGRSSVLVSPTGELLPLDDAMRAQVIAENDRLASHGMRVLAFAGKHFDPATFKADGEHLEQMNDLTLYALVGIVDPPRPTAKETIRRAADAGIRVRMITGDHVVTAAAIANELGIPGRAISGKEFSAMDDATLAREIDEIGVIARVAPEDKVRLVDALQKKGEIVAMTGDGVNDAPALKKADIGVAMGITGTEATKEAAAMILTDDNFSTIVKAVEKGRELYDNLMKYIRFQLAQLVGFILIFLGSALLNIVGGVPFTAAQILWINFLVDAPPGVMLGNDTATGDLMKEAPRDASQGIVTVRLGIWYGLGGLCMAISTLGVMAWFEARGLAVEVLYTLGFVCFTLSHLFSVYAYRNPRQSVFTMESFNNCRLNIAVVCAFAAILLATELPFLQKGLRLVSLSFDGWVYCTIVASLILWVSEAYRALVITPDMKAKMAAKQEG